MALVIDIASWILIIAGSVFSIIGGIGMIRMPDFYTRTHAASITDTMGAGCLLLGLALQAGWSLVLAKILFILLFLFFTSPTASHAIGKSAYLDGIKPLLKGKLKGSKLDDAQPEGEKS